jgi:hypothetical protein
VAAGRERLVTESLPQQPPEDLPDFGMTTDEGNARVDLLVREIAAVIDAGGAERREIVVALSDGVRDISAEHPEVLDTTVRDAILRELKPTFDRVGWEILTPFEF